VTTRAPAAAPATGVTATDTSTTSGTPAAQVTVAWTPSANADSYVLMRATDAAFTQNVTSVPVPGGATPSYQDTTVT
jgi:hypothetical protein